MVRPQIIMIPLAAALACSFDSVGAVSSGSTNPPSSSSEGGEGETTASMPTSEGDPTSGAGPTSEQGTESSTTAVGPTADPSSESSGETGGGCGDGVVDPGEACDGADVAGQTCADFGLVDGALACAGDCTIDTSGCLPIDTCGDGKLDPGEMCDGAELDGQDCVGLGFELGELTCAGNCAFETGGCVDVADDWYDLKFLKRRKLTIPGAGIAGDLTDFPVVLSITDAAVLMDLTPADKIVFADVDEQVLAHEVEYVDANRLILWVEVPTLAAGVDTVFYVYYENPAAMDAADPKATWSNGFLAVWHLDEDVPDEQETGKHLDSTEGGHTGTQKDTQGADFGVCRIGRCQEVGASDWIEVDKDGDFKIGNADATVSAWVYGFNANMTARAIFAKSNPMMAEDGHVIFGQSSPGDSNALGVEQRGVGTFAGTTAIANGGWHHVVWTQTKDFMGSAELWRLYVDGAPDGEMQMTGLAAVGAHVARIGGPTANSSFPANFQGRIDEVQVSTTDRSAEWVKTAYDNQRAPGMFTMIGPEEGF